MYYSIAFLETTISIYWVISASLPSLIKSRSSIGDLSAARPVPWTRRRQVCVSLSISSQVTTSPLARLPDAEDSSPAERVGQATSSVRDDTNATRASSAFGKHELGSTAWRKRQRLDGIASKLLNKLPSKGAYFNFCL